MRSVDVDMMYVGAFENLKGLGGSSKVSRTTVKSTYHQLSFTLLHVHLYLPHS